MVFGFPMAASAGSRSVLAAAAGPAAALLAAASTNSTKCTTTCEDTDRVILGFIPYTAFAIVVSVLLVMLSGLFSGLTLGLLGSDLVNLRVSCWLCAAALPAVRPGRGVQRSECRLGSLPQLHTYPL